MEKFELAIKNFSLDKTILSEQCPAELWYFEELAKEWISYIPINKKWFKVCLKQKNNKLIIHYFPKAEKEEKESLEEAIKYIFWIDYDFEDLYSAFHDDKYIKNLLRNSEGIRVMRDINKEYRTYEAVITQFNSVKRIKKMQNLLFKNYGEKVKIGNEEIYTYPKADRIAKVSEKELREKIKLGYRAPYLLNMAKEITNDKTIIEKIDIMKTKEARKYLMNFKGIGIKIADIILMYGFGKRDAFPLDVWVKNAIKREYFENKDVSNKEIMEFACNYFGKYASIINLLIFSNERESEKEFFNFCIWK